MAFMCVTDCVRVCVCSPRTQDWTTFARRLNWVDTDLTERDAILAFSFSRMCVCDVSDECARPPTKGRPPTAYRPLPAPLSSDMPDAAAPLGSSGRHGRKRDVELPFEGFLEALVRVSVLKVRVQPSRPSNPLCP